MRFLPVSFLHCTFVLALLSLPRPSHAAGPPTLKKLTLAQALAASVPQTEGLMLTVSAEKLTLPDGTEAPQADASIDDIAAAFGDETASFGTVTAVAPATMVLLNTQPDVPDVMADLNQTTALKMLAASLDDTQWQALTSERGLGLADLTDDTQRKFFHALFRHGQLWIGSEDPALAGLPDDQRTDVRDLTDQIDTTCIRLGQTANIDLHDRQGKTIYFSEARPDAALRLHTWRPKVETLPNEYGTAWRTTVANTLKPSDLDWDSVSLQVQIPTSGIKTVGDLVARVGRRTGLELYADPHYAARTVTLRGPVVSEPAFDLLQALCLCITGTFRSVGPAFVLTDNIAGVGVRRKRIDDWEKDSFQAQNKMQEQAGQTMLSHRTATVRTLPTFEDPLAVTPEEMATIPDSTLMPGIPDDDVAPYPFAKLTPAQQAWMRQTAASFAEKHRGGTLPDYLKDESFADADLSGKVELRVEYKIQLLVPSQNMPIDSSLQMPLYMLFWPGIKPLLPNAQEMFMKAQAKLPPAPPLAPLLRTGHIRAVEGHPRTAKDVDALVASMQTLGLNTLVLDIFSGGVDHLKSSAAVGTDILTEVLTRTRGTGIQVYADMSLLAWGEAPPETARDQTILGQNSREAANQHEKISPSDDFDDQGFPVAFVAPPVHVSPAASEVHNTLAALVQGLSARAGLAGLVWEDADTDDDLGYTPEMRLSFLRTTHADPLDITKTSYTRADTTLPLFDDELADADLPTRWTKARSDTDSALLSQLFAVCRAGSGSRVLPILMDQGEGRTHWLASWDDPAKLPPPLRDLASNQAYSETMHDVRTQGRIVLLREIIEHDSDTTALARRLSEHLNAMRCDGFMLDFRADDVTQGAAPLASLIQVATAPQAQGSR